MCRGTLVFSDDSLLPVARLAEVLHILNYIDSFNSAIRKFVKLEFLKIH